MRLHGFPAGYGVDAFAFFCDGLQLPRLTPKDDAWVTRVVHPESVDICQPADDIGRTDHAVKVIVGGRLLPPSIDPLVVVLKIVAHAQVVERRIVLNLQRLAKRLSPHRRFRPVSTLAPQGLGRVASTDYEHLTADPKLILVSGASTLIDHGYRGQDEPALVRHLALKDSHQQKIHPHSMGASL